jgi:hypothetical protein
MSTTHDDSSSDASQDPTSGDAGSERSRKTGGSGYDHVRDDFNRLRFEEQASFLVEAAVSVAARGIETVGRTLASELEDLFDEAKTKQHPGGERAGAPRDPAPGPAEPETAQSQSHDAPSSDADTGDANTGDASGDDPADPGASARPDEPTR